MTGSAAMFADWFAVTAVNFAAAVADGVDGLQPVAVLRSQLQGAASCTGIVAIAAR